MSAEAESGGETPNVLDINDVQRRISALEEDAADESVAELLNALDWFIIEFKRLDAQKRKLENRVDDLESRVPPSGLKADANDSLFDARDRAVIDAIDKSGKSRVELNELKALYRRHTDIRNPRTMKDRVKSLTATAQFENVSPCLWEYTPNVD